MREDTKESLIVVAGGSRCSDVFKDVEAVALDDMSLLMFIFPLSSLI